MSFSILAETSSRASPSPFAFPQEQPSHSINKMSHTVTVTRTTTTSTSTAILVNTGFLKTTPGFLKFLETIIAAVCLFLAFFFDYDRAYNVRAASFEFFICVMTAALVASGCILIASLLSLSTASILAKTFFELIYHSVAFGLTLACSITFFFDANNRWNNNKILAGPILGLILSVLYLISSVFAFRGYRGL